MTKQVRSVRSWLFFFDRASPPVCFERRRNKSKGEDAWRLQMAIEQRIVHCVRPLVATHFGKRFSSFVVSMNWSLLVSNVRYIQGGFSKEQYTSGIRHFFLSKDHRLGCTWAPYLQAGGQFPNGSMTHVVAFMLSSQKPPTFHTTKDPRCESSLVCPANGPVSNELRVCFHGLLAVCGQWDGFMIQNVKIIVLKTRRHVPEPIDVRYETQLWVSLYCAMAVEETCTVCEERKFAPWHLALEQLVTYIPGVSTSTFKTCYK